MRVALVLGVATAVVVEGADLEAVVRAQRGGGAGAFVDVVAEVDGEVDLFLREVRVRGEESLIPALAGGKREGQRGLRTRRRRRAEPAHIAYRLTGHEAIEVPPVGLQSVHVHVYAERELGGRGGAPFLHDLGELRIVGHFPAHDGAGPLHAAVGFEGARGQTRPEDAAGGSGVT